MNYKMFLVECSPNNLHEPSSMRRHNKAHLEARRVKYSCEYIISFLFLFLHRRFLGLSQPGIESLLGGQPPDLSNRLVNLFGGLVNKLFLKTYIDSKYVLN